MFDGGTSGTNKWPSTAREIGRRILLAANADFASHLSIEPVGPAPPLALGPEGNTLIDNHLLSGRPARSASASLRSARSPLRPSSSDVSARVSLRLSLSLSPYRPFPSSPLFQQRRVPRLKHHLLIFHLSRARRALALSRTFKFDARPSSSLYEETFFSRA